MKLKWSPTRLLALLALLLTGSVIAIRVTSAEPLDTAATSMVRYVAGLQPVQGPGREMAALRERPALLTGAQPLRASSPYTNPWQLQATLPGAIIKDISFSTSQVGYIAAELGQVWKTTNGGANWTRIMNLGFPYYWYGVAALDANNVVISGFINNAQSGVIRRSTDGGATWTPNITLTTDGWSFRVRFADNLHGFVLDGLNYSAPNAGHYTINGGPTAADWTEVVPDPDGGWFGNQFSLLPNLKTRIAGISYCTSPDVGANWVCGPSIDPVFDGPVFYADDQTGWVGGGSISPSVEGWAHRTTDGGATWSGRTLQAAWPVREFRFVDGQRGWAAGGNIYSNSGGLYFSSDGGQTWSLDASTGAEMDACDSRDTGSGQQVWCAGYTGSFNGVVYTLLPGTTTTPTPVPSNTSTISAPTNTVPVPTMTATHTATQLPVTSTTTPTPVPSSTSTVSTPQATPTCSPSGGPYDIAIVFSDDAPPGKLIDYIEVEPDVALVVPVDARFSTPALSQLLLYDEVVLFSNTEYDDPVALGNVIADYQDAGGIVVATNANWYGPPYGLDGRWMTGGYTMFNYPVPSNNSTSTLGTYDPAHPLMQGVTELTAFFRTQATLTAGATQVAAWADSWPLVAYKTTNGHTAVGINAYLGFPEEGWDGDFGTLIVNAARWLKPGAPCGSATPQASATAQATSTPVPSSTSTISAPTNTVPVPTMTATHTATQLPVTATPCRLTFTDVPPDSTFYTFIRCLACRGIISGYADGTFRPNNEVTRGQLAKIVSNAAGFSEDAGPQVYEDVPPANTFYAWINRLTRRGYMSGYVCGGVGEPCVNGDRPYFRPVANATRGQTSKIVANAAGFTEEPTEQTFEDVPSDHTFYREIQRLASRNIMGGYPCGGIGEPCLSGKPYFRPQNNVTRGQSTKIGANTFFPNCLMRLNP